MPGQVQIELAPAFFCADLQLVADKRLENYRKTTGAVFRHSTLRGAFLPPYL